MINRKWLGVVLFVFISLSNGVVYGEVSCDDVVVSEQAITLSGLGAIATGASGDAMQGFTTLDFVILIVYIIGIIMFGVYFCRRQKSVADFFLGGRSLGWFPIAISVIASDLSASSYMGTPAFAFIYNLRYAVVIVISPVIAVIAVCISVRLFYRAGFYTVYEYLEHRYNVWLRCFGSLLFMIIRLSWMATVVYIPSLALSVVMGLNVQYCVLIVGVIATIYVLLGGIEAVIWSDVFQFFILVAGIIISLGYIIWDFGGDVGHIWNIASAQGKTDLVSLDLDFGAEFTLWGLLMGISVISMFSYGFDQMVVQRYFTAKSTKQAVIGAISQGFIGMPVSIGLFFIGTCLVAYYTKYPAMMESLMASDPENPIAAMDRVFPHFITYALPAGISGLIIAGILSATMSSIDSGVNSLSTTAVMDFYKRFWHRPDKSDKHYLNAARIATIFFGLLATTGALFIRHLGSIAILVPKINSFMTGPLVGLFLLGLLTRRANSAGVFLGMLIAFIATIILATYTDVFWLWHGPFGLLISVVAGYLLSLLWPAPTKKQLTIVEGQI